MRKLICLLAVVFLMTGCKTTLKSNWSNFNAYYNTFYNANKSYDAGLKKNLGQAREYNPLQPIRIHEKPVNAGSQDFQKAIEKGADILRKHDDTKWVDDALFLIGKSYYFNREYFSAVQKFKELFVTTENPELQHKALIWQGRTLLEMELYGEGIAFLADEIALFDDEWSEADKAEMKSLLAQHYIGNSSWELARQELSESIPHLSKKEYRERGYFLLGQVYERLENTTAAFEAYNKVQENYTEYRLQYLAKRKTAEVARDLERHDVAFSIFNEMVRDDKNIDYKAELDFELARTEQQRGNYTRAEAVYKNILRNPLNNPTPEIAARTYYGLAEIYRYNYNDFNLAATYYDSAAQKNVPSERLPENFAAAEYAESFGEYSRLKTDIILQDSLLRLGQLPKDELDSVIVQLRKKKLAELEELQRQNEAQQNTVVTLDENVEEQDATSLRNGFLNSDNPVLQQNARMQFIALWGDRPLADNWRVRSLIQSSRVENANGEGEGGMAVETEDVELLQVNIDMSVIPFTENEQDSVRKKIATLQYELGNLFFLSLNMPDSAAYYFEKAVQNPSRDNINVVSLYSLSELYSIEGDEEKSREYADILIENYPSSEYAFRLGERFGVDINLLDESASIDPLQLYEVIIAQDSIGKSVKAEKLKNFVQSFPEHKVAPKAQFDAIKLYMELGKQDSLYEEKIDQWVTENNKWEQQQADFQAQIDSAEITLQDTTISEVERAELSALTDSSLTHPDFTMIFPYTGAHWDSARSAIDTFIENYPDSRYITSVEKLQEELRLSGDRISGMEKVEGTDSEEEQISGYTSCSEIEAELQPRGGMEAFISSLNLDAELLEELDDQTFTYQFLVNQRGIIDDFTLQSENISAEIQTALESAFESALSFEPVLHNGQATKVQCNISFPLGNQVN